MVKKIFILIISIVLLLVTVSFSRTITRITVHDGDTFTLHHTEGVLKIRLADIDAPELKQTYGEKAKEYLHELIQRKSIKIIPIDKDRFGRIIAKVYCDDKCINHEMIKNGYAWHYKKHSSDKELVELENNAKNFNKGLWKEQNPTPPWEYRKSYSASKHTSKYKCTGVSRDGAGGYICFFEDEINKKRYSTNDITHIPIAIHDEFAEKIKEYEREQTNFYSQTSCTQSTSYIISPANSLEKTKDLDQLKPVRVKSYYRKDGKYVRSHSRNFPKR
jgi:endonuclease YncB( thermonuclease family)